jgi:hypothetical protein
MLAAVRWIRLCFRAIAGGWTEHTNEVSSLSRRKSQAVAKTFHAGLFLQRRWSVAVALRRMRNQIPRPAQSAERFVARAVFNVWKFRAGENLAGAPSWSQRDVRSYPAALGFAMRAMPQ